MASSMCKTGKIFKPLAAISVDSFESSVKNPVVGDSFTVKTVIKNTGTLAGNVRVTFRDGSQTGSVIGSPSTMTIQPGSSTTVESVPVTVDVDEAVAKVCLIVECISGCE